LAATLINLTIPKSSLSTDIQELLYQGKIKPMLIDYATNNIVGFTDKEEVEVFSFKDYLIMDNRFNRPTITYNDEGLHLQIVRTRP
jgi:hypothetical protein